MKRQALISVFDKSGITELADALTALGWEIISTGGTAAYLRKAGFTVVEAMEITGFPDCLGGRVKTLHPAIHAGILAKRRDRSHLYALEILNLRTIDLVAVNLYPFFHKIAETPPAPPDEMIEFIDIGGPAMLRSAAKNFDDVIALCDPADYGGVIKILKSGGEPDTGMRKRLAAKVFNLTSAYDAAVSRYLSGGDDSRPFQDYHAAPLKLASVLRYGENPRQKAALYVNVDGRGALAGMKQLSPDGAPDGAPSGGKELGYNNYRDADLAWKAVSSFGCPSTGAKPLGADEAARLLNVADEGLTPACVAVKHNTPCGAALGKTAFEAFEKTYLCDTVSIFGGIVAFNTALDVKTARKLNGIFLEIVIAPAYSGAALAVLREKPNLRVIKASAAPSEKTECVSLDGGLLVQDVNGALLEKWDVVTKTPVDERDIPDMLFGLRLVNWVKSNAVVVVKDEAAVGIGGGRTNRIDAARQAISAARAGRAALPPARVLVSDAFFPFPDVVEAAAEAGIKAIVQSGGSNNDRLSIDACDRFGIAMVFTGMRYFKH